MNVKLILKTLGKILLIEAGYMFISLLVALYYKESVFPFLIAIGGMLLCALPLMLLRPPKTIFSARDGLAGVALIWLTMSAFGAVPFLADGHFGNYISCFFESASGFTTTGATVLAEIESLPKGILFWRSSTHWLGGMGILVLALALFPSIGERAQNLMAAESPGPTSEKLTARISTSSKILYIIYMGLTVFMIIALLCTKMDLYDSVVTTLATAGTGGFAVLNNSIAGYNNLASEIVITIFTALFGINFTVFFMLLTRQFRKALFNSEVVFYLSTIGISTILIAFNIYSMYQSIGQALRHASFNVVTIITTTGFSSTDFDTWPQFSKVILVLLMVLGACAGSTGGGLKCSRVLILCKAVLREIRRMITPRRISILKMDGKPIPETTITNTSVFAALYFAIAIGAMLIVAIDNFDFTTTIVSVISCIGNVGPALGPVAGPTGNYNSFSDLSKIVLSLCMLVGRLEIFPMIVLFYPKAWKGTLAKK
ncbi:MAG: TrkH family potassium uptake protein [Clostridia bacterium]|nr:TrkH family potassium uptake protein [Clostridia bacterium]